MQLISYPSVSEWPALLGRPAQDFGRVEQVVAPILQRVRSEGDRAVRDFSWAFDGVPPGDFAVKEETLRGAGAHLSEALKRAIGVAKDNLTVFHAAQRGTTERIETMPGVVCWRKSVGIEKVGLYIPGGTAPLFSTVLMLGVPAQLAGCREVILCTPAGKSGIHPAILYAAHLVGIRCVFAVGGAQAVAAMAYGTETVPKVHKIFGPGNQYVTVAKQLVSKEGTAIDMPAGPSEVAVYADDTAVPAFVAADLLSQAEHGVDSQVILVSESGELIELVREEVEKQLASLPRREIATQALISSKAILVRSQQEAIDLLNEYAAEHLILAVRNAEAVGERIVNAGSIFLGNYSPEAAGDYASGTNHTLPTNGFAKAYSGVSLDSFVKKITFQQISPRGLREIGPAVEAMAEAESLGAHKEAVSIRLRLMDQLLIDNEQWTMDNGQGDITNTNAGLPMNNEPRGGPQPTARRAITINQQSTINDQRSTINEQLLASVFRPHILRLTPYSSARDEYSGQEGIFLDANENPLGSVTAAAFNRYPDPYQGAVKEKLAVVKGVRPAQIFLGNGSDEGIDLLIRATCEPRQDNILIMPPTYGMYEVSAAINDVPVIRVPLTPEFGIDPENVLAAITNRTKLVFVCSPNNPTGNVLDREAVRQILVTFRGLVVVDEAYADFAPGSSWLAELDAYPNLVVLQTFSKAWGLASLRLGMAYASEEMIRVLNKIKPPYNVNGLTQNLVNDALRDVRFKEEMVARILQQRDVLREGLRTIPGVERVYPSDANFLLVKFADAKAVFAHLLERKIIARDRSNAQWCAGCLRITVGTAEENAALMEALRSW